jgi:hypothetical protein
LFTIYQGSRPQQLNGSNPTLSLLEHPISALEVLT